MKHWLLLTLIVGETKWVLIQARVILDGLFLIIGCLTALICFFLQEFAAESTFEDSKQIYGLKAVSANKVLDEGLFTNTDTACNSNDHNLGL